MGDFGEVRKIAPLFPDFVSLLILLVFIFQFFPFQFIFFLFNRDNLITGIKVTELRWLSPFLLVKRSVLLGKQCRASNLGGEHQHAWTYRETGRNKDHSFGSFSGRPGIVRLETFMKTLTNLFVSSLMYKYTQKGKWMSARHASTMRAPHFWTDVCFNRGREPVPPQI